MENGVTPTNKYLRHGWECVTIDLDDSSDVATMQEAYEAPSYAYLIYEDDYVFANDYD